MSCGSNARQRRRLGELAAHRQGGLRALSMYSPGLLLVSWPPSQNSLRAQRPLRSDSCDKSVYEARKRAATKSSKPRRLAKMRRGLPGHDFAETWLALDGRKTAHHVSSRQAVPGRGLISVAAAMLGLGAGALARIVTDSSRLFERSGLRARSELRDADPRPSIAAKSERSADRHSNESPAGYRLPRREDLPLRGR